ncbi:MAG: hypothetical protein OHK0031_05770 [Anaerolineales bacterium]
MTDSEREQVLKMIDEGKISAEQGLKLIQALTEDDEQESPALAAPEAAESGFSAEAAPDPQVESLKRRVRFLYLIPLSLGVLLTVWMAWLMYSSVQAHDTGLVFYCLLFPALLLGIFLLSLGAASQSSRWLYLDVQQKPGEKPAHILLGFPLDWVRWLLSLFGGAIPSKEKYIAEAMMTAIADSTGASPLVVQVDEGDNGEKVKIYIG